MLNHKDLEDIDFSTDCYIDLHVERYGSLSGLFYTGGEDLKILSTFFRESHDWEPSFTRNGKSYVKGFIDPGNKVFQDFMQQKSFAQEIIAHDFYVENGHYEQTCDFYDIWDENDISDIQISFPRC